MFMDKREALRNLKRYEYVEGKTPKLIVQENSMELTGLYQEGVLTFYIARGKPTKRIRKVVKPVKGDYMLGRSAICSYKKNGVLSGFGILKAVPERKEKINLTREGSTKKELELTPTKEREFECI